MANITLSLTAVSVLHALTGCAEKELLAIVEKLGIDVFYWNGIPSVHDDNVKLIMEYVSAPAKR